MTLREWCDFAYMMWADDVDRRALADRQVSAVFLAAGAAGATLVDPVDVRRTFDEWLDSDLEPAVGVDADRRRLLEVLGVAS